MTIFDFGRGAGMACAMLAGFAAGAAQADVNKSVEVGPIFSQADADKMCPAAAVATGGTWTRQWWTTVWGKMSVCQISYQTGTDDVAAGPIWDTADAGVKCPVVAYAVNGAWNGQWATTIPDQMSTCGIDLVK